HGRLPRVVQRIFFIENTRQLPRGPGQPHRGLGGGDFGDLLALRGYLIILEPVPLNAARSWPTSVEPLGAASITTRISSAVMPRSDSSRFRLASISSRRNLYQKYATKTAAAGMDRAAKLRTT